MSLRPMNILLIEDQGDIADFVCQGLQARGMTVEHANNGHVGYDRVMAGKFDLVVLDIMLPGRDGLSVLTDMRRQGNHTPVILLTARNELGDRIRGLEVGADDYLAKPFYVEELAARIFALLRRDRQSALQVGDIRLDRVAREVRCNDHGVDLTAREFTMLEYLMRSPGEVFSRTQILEHVWGYDFDPNTNVVDVCIKRIRGKIDDVLDNKAPSPIESVRGRGYRFRLPP